jgi:hypothetical protein
MNLVRLSATLLTFAAATAQAADTAHAALDTVSITARGRVVVDCSTERLPTFAAVADLLGTNNGSRIYGERGRMANVAHRACMRGAGAVAFVRDDAAPQPAFALADATR